MKAKIGIFGTLACAAALMISGFASEAGARGPNRITTRAACKRYTSGGAQSACIACVKKGNDYFRNSGRCKR